MSDVRGLWNEGLIIEEKFGDDGVLFIEPPLPEQLNDYRLESYRRFIVTSEDGSRSMIDRQFDNMAFRRRLVPHLKSIRSLSVAGNPLADSAENREMLVLRGEGIDSAILRAAARAGRLLEEEKKAEEKKAEADRQG